MKFYIDTSIWIDFYEDRKGYNDEPLGQFAYKLINLILAEKHELVISDVVITELSIYYSLTEIKSILTPIDKNMIKKIASNEQKQEAKIISITRNVPAADVLHALISRDNSAILISRDTHFKKLSDITEYFKPEDIT